MLLLLSQLDTLDRIAAVVDDRAIWLSDVDEKVQVYAVMYGVPPQQLPQLRREVLQQMVDMELLYLKVKEDTTISVSQDEINRAVDVQIQQMKGQMSDEEFEKVLKGMGFTLDGYRRYIRDEVKKTLYIQKYVELKVKPNISVDEKELKEFYERVADSLATPGEYKLAVISLMVKPSASAEQDHYERAKRIYTQLKKGALWEDMVARFSDDRESARRGGDLGVVPKNALPPNFVKEIERTPEGGITKPLRGPQGYHIFKVIAKREDAFLLSHILIRVSPSEKDVQKTLRKAERILKKIKAGQSFSLLAKRYSEDPVSKENGGELGWVSERMLPPDIVEALKKAEVGDVVGPIVSPDRTMVNIFKILDRREGERPTLEQVRQLLIAKKVEERLQEVIEEAKKDYYVRIYL